MIPIANGTRTEPIILTKRSKKKLSNKKANKSNKAKKKNKKRGIPARQLKYERKAKQKKTARKEWWASLSVDEQNEYIAKKERQRGASRAQSMEDITWTAPDGVYKKTWNSPDSYTITRSKTP